jgi:hypothetical protein
LGERAIKPGADVRFGSEADSNVTPVDVRRLLSVKRQHSQHRSGDGAVVELREGQADRSVVLISMFDPSV